MLRLLRLTVVLLGWAALVLALAVQSPLHAQSTSDDEEILYGPEPYEPLTECPTGSVELAPGDNIQRIIDAQPGSATFCLTEGVYENITIVPRTGDTFIGLDGAVLDGGGGGVPHAFDAIFEPNSPDPITDVTIRGLTIQNYYGEPIYRDFVTPYGAIEGGEGWIIEYNTVQDNLSGINLGYANWGWGDGAIVRHNRIINNAYIGIETNGSNITFEHNELAGNGWDLTDEERAWSGGGSKFTDQGVFADQSFDAQAMVEVDRQEVDGIHLRYNWVHHNLGNGFWLDINNRNAIVENNLFEGNYGSGFFDELSNGTTVRDNVFRDNRFGNQNTGLWGGAEILIANSQNGEIYDNDITVTGTSRAIIMIYEESRSENPFQNYSIHDNVIHFMNEPVFVAENLVDNFTGGEPLQGIVGGQGEGNFYQNNNRFDSNTYYVQDRALNYFFWGQSLNWSGFRSAGQEANGECFIMDTEEPC